MSGHRPLNYLPVRPDWLAAGYEDPLKPELPIIDAHHHLWDRPGWRYLFEEYLTDVRESGHKVEATVYMQAQTMYRAEGPPAFKVIGETEFANGVAAMAASGLYGPTRVCAGIIGHVDLRGGTGVAAVLEDHLRAAGDRFRGIRHLTTWDPDASLTNPLSACPPGLLGDTVFRAGFSCLAPLNLSYDAWLFHTQIDELTDLARAFPTTTIVLNHCGGVLGIGAYAGRREEIFAQWSKAIRRLAECPNAVVKLGGLGMRINGFGFETGAVPPSSDQLAQAWRPYIETCIEAFGPVRCMFESNFPVDKGSYGYGTLWNAFKRLTQQAGDDEISALFSGTAARIYAVPTQSRAA